MKNTVKKMAVMLTVFLFSLMSIVTVISQEVPPVSGSSSSGGGSGDITPPPVPGTSASPSPADMAIPETGTDPSPEDMASGGGGSSSAPLPVRPVTSEGFPAYLPVQSIEAYRAYILENVSRVSLSVNGESVAGSKDQYISLPDEAKGDPEMMLKVLSDIPVDFSIYDPEKTITISVALAVELQSENGGYGFGLYGYAHTKPVAGKGDYYTLPNVAIELQTPEQAPFVVQSFIHSALFEEYDDSGNVINQHFSQVRNGFLIIPAYYTSVKAGRVVLRGWKDGQGVSQEYNLKIGIPRQKESVLSRGIMTGSIKGVTVLTNPTKVQFRAVYGRHINQLFVLRITQPLVNLTELTAEVTYMSTGGPVPTEVARTGNIRRAGGTWEKFETFSGKDILMQKGIYYLYFDFTEPFGKSGNSAEAPQNYYGEKG